MDVSLETDQKKHILFSEALYQLVVTLRHVPNILPLQSVLRALSLCGWMGAGEYASLREDVLVRYRAF